MTKPSRNSLRIHGMYCGPGWTRGQFHPEAKMFELEYVRPIDDLDYACMIHDTSIAMEGTSRSSDLQLAEDARRIAKANKFKNPFLAAKAKAVEKAMRIASTQRKNQD